MFKCGDLIVYGNNGVCCVEDITTIESSGDKLYYVLKNLTSNGVAYVPVNSGVYTRPVMSRDEMEDILNQIPHLTTNSFEKIPPRESQKVYRDTMMSYDSLAILSLIKHLKTVAKKKQEFKKKLSVTEERFLEQALKVIGTELSVAYGIDFATAKEEILKRLNSLT